MIRRLLTCLLGAAFLQGCLHVPASGDRIYDGVWVSADANVGNVILRNPDGTFEEKKTQRYDFSKPPITYTAGGLWRVSKGRYILTYRRISTDVFAGESRKSFEMSVIDVGSGKFRYVSTDGAVVEEIRVGKSDTELYNRTPIPLIGTELPQLPGKSLPSNNRPLPDNEPRFRHPYCTGFFGADVRRRCD